MVLSFDVRIFVSTKSSLFQKECFVGLVFASCLNESESWEILFLSQWCLTLATTSAANSQWKFLLRPIAITYHRSDRNASYSGDRQQSLDSKLFKVWILIMTTLTNLGFSRGASWRTERIEMREAVQPIGSQYHPHHYQHHQHPHHHQHHHQIQSDFWTGLFFCHNFASADKSADMDLLFSCPAQYLPS